MLIRRSNTRGKLIVVGGQVEPFGLQTSDFWQGALAGLGVVLLGVSIPLNLMAIRRWRERCNRLGRFGKVDR